MIYFIENAERQAIKIGYSGNPWLRFHALKTASPDPLVLLCVIEGDQGAERRMHRDWADHRLSGEWFKDTPELRATIERHRKANGVGPISMARSVEERKAGCKSPFRWVCAENPPGFRRPEWMRSAALHDDGTVFIPAAIWGDEDSAVLSAAWDGNVPLVVDDGHAYLPASWLAENIEDREFADVCRLIQSRTRRHFEAEANP